MKREVRDHLGRRIEVADPPRRLVCLCPSLTETLYTLGLGDRVVGRTGYCVRPADAVARVPVIGGTKSISLDAIAALAPDLVIADKEENDRAQVESLMSRHAVYVIEVNGFDDALRAVRDVGEVTGAGEAAAGLVKRINRAFDGLSPQTFSRARLWPALSSSNPTSPRR
ncbi:MAG: helical backbone metal receptor [Planctomycetota bacterium]|nr:helical backbone metal receptor [Planctomycetota bacterium]